MSEFSEWLLYETVEPFGDRRGDIQTGIVASTLANIHRSEHRSAYTFTDFMIEWEPREIPEQTPEQQLGILLMLQQVQNMRLGAE